MGWWQVDADTLADSRFAVSPLAETVGALKTLHRGTAPHPGERAWLDDHLPAYRARLAEDPVTAPLIRAALGRTWTADFLTPTPTGEDGPGGFPTEVAGVRDTRPEAARSDLLASLGGPLPAVLHRDDLPERAAALLEWVWERTVAPSWPRRRGVIEADIVARAARGGRDGWAAALEGMGRGRQWLGDSRLQINTRANPPRDIVGARLLFVPVTPGHGWVSWHAPHRYAIVYPCSGTLADQGGAVAVPEALGALLGTARARVLVLLGTPKSTTHLVALTGQGLGSVGRHLRVLLDAGLIGRRRAGRSVLYYRTETGEAVAAGRGGG
ncbi:helix-turn-helix transcriptional regulator [uncultured Streptomyces sp.]|uniref:ArsR/SmtB family transcription factor n=1 Tax=uncultured Streptomyces sp. TaxID=174707 RepID=UPI00261518F0|nr:helix-turn-helix domain-containing protein [uncultured Streptomyces sp.]